MSGKMTIAVLLSITLAVGAPMLSAVKKAEQFQKYPSFRAKIEPYDPRDLFYGHYLQFRTAWNWKEKVPEDSQKLYGQRKACLCVGEGNFDPVVSVAECPSQGKTLPDCRFTLRGESQGNWNFDNGVSRYYVDETLAKPLEDLFMREKREFSLDLHVTPDGKTLPGLLYIEGVPLKDFIAQNGGTIPAEKENLEQ